MFDDWLQNLWGVDVINPAKALQSIIKQKTYLTWNINKQKNNLKLITTNICQDFTLVKSLFKSKSSEESSLQFSQQR